MAVFDDVFSEYSKSITNGKETTLNFILSNKNKIKEAVGFYGFKQFALNYRIYFDQRNIDKILFDLEKYVLTKQTRHKSDLAIGHNVLTKLHVEPELERRVIDFMFERMKDTYLVKYRDMPHLKNAYELKKRLVVNEVYDKILRVSDRTKR